MKRWPLLLIVSGCLTGCGETSAPNSTANAPAQAPGQNANSPAAAVPAPNYDQLLKDADVQLQSRNGNQAVQLLSQAITANPKRIDAYLKRASVLAEAKLTAAAVNDMTSAIALDPRNAKLLNTRGYFLLVSQQYDRASADFSDAIGLDLQYPQPYNNRGLCQVALGNFEEGIKDFDNALRAKADYVDAHNNRGFALMQFNRTEEALASFTKTLELDPKYINALSNRGRCYLKLNRPAEAAADYTSAIALQPDTIVHYASRAEAHKANNDQAACNADLHFAAWLRGLDELNQRIARNTRDADAWSERGRHLLLQDRQAEAERSLQNALTLKPDHAQALSGRAQLAMRQEKYEQAIADSTRALALDRRFETYSLRGDAYFATGKFGDAIADYEASRRFDRQVVEAYRQRALQLRNNGDEQLAQADEKFAAGLEKQLTEAVVEQDRTAPRAMVIEQVSYEVPAAEKSAQPQKSAASTQAK
ncbi:tetratricopeptide repeat protein [Planctomicrobium piriforme]|uniref:Tetratricopeptide repeat-containing protein n=1 Tax=Planctomicrobium piriforme TaxID=1576369 RepID=A0A1I3MXF9_9PLAN|nr:tetratricopeptide repeat protein [Planctomicrobium piriforme]SFJ01470.1 Tetratricopeptide repeat-containing protein [Planctomicrobium piriforme]